MEAPTVGAGKLTVERKGSNVIMTQQCTDDYAAILFFDRLIKELQDGVVTIKLETV